MLLNPDTLIIQHKFASYCRTGVADATIPAGIPGNMPHYRRLVFNVVKGTMEQAFPITHKILQGEIWDNLVYQFFAEHDCQTPQVWRLPEEFALFIKAMNLAERLDIPYLKDLTWFEWLEIEVHTMPDIPIGTLKKEGNIFTDKLVLNQEFRLCRLSYPIHMRSVDEAVRLKGDYFVLIFREPETGQVKFISLSLLLAFVIEQLAIQPVSLASLINPISEVFPIEDTRELRNHLEAFTEDLFYQKMLLGFTP